MGTIAVLTGGSAATYYAPETYQSRDADFVISLSVDPTGAGATLRALGYHELGGTYHHDSNVFTARFSASYHSALATISFSHTTQSDAAMSFYKDYLAH